MSLFGSISKGLFGSSNGKTAAPPDPMAVWNQSFGMPFLMQGFSLLAALGMKPDEAFGGQFIKSGVGKNGAGPPGSQLEWVPIGGGKWADVGLLMEKFPELTKQAEEMQQEMDISSFNKSWDLLQNVPALASMVGEAKGNFGLKLTEDLSKGFDLLAQGALGSAAPGGFLHDPLTQAKVLGPLALQKSMTEYQIQNKAQMDLLNLAGGGYLPGTSPLAGDPYTSSQVYAPLVQGSYGFLGNLGMFNAGQSQQAQQFNISSAQNYWKTLVQGANAGAQAPAA